MRRLFVRGLSTPGDVARWTGLRHVGAIPRARLPATQRNPSTAVVEYDDPPLAAAFRDLHAAILREHPHAQVFALSSALPKDGKTTCSVALARQSALCGFRTVLVDCDLRRRSASAELDDRPATGLIEVLYGQAALDAALYRDGFTRLSVLPVSTNMHLVRKAVVQDILSGAAAAELVAELRRRFDHVFIDTPPVLAVADGRRLAQLADVVLFVTQWRRTPKDSVAEALKLLRGAGASLAGLVLTRSPRGAVWRRRLTEELRNG